MGCGCGKKSVKRNVKNNVKYEDNKVNRASRKSMLKKINIKAIKKTTAVKKTT